MSYIVVTEISPVQGCKTEQISSDDAWKMAEEMVLRVGLLPLTPTKLCIPKLKNYTAFRISQQTYDFIQGVATVKTNKTW